MYNCMASTNYFSSTLIIDKNLFFGHQQLSFRLAGILLQYYAAWYLQF